MANNAQDCVICNLAWSDAPSITKTEKAIDWLLVKLLPRSVIRKIVQGGRHHRLQMEHAMLCARERENNHATFFRQDIRKAGVRRFKNHRTRQELIRARCLAS